MIHVISLGAGVQSSTMALMAAHGDIKPMPKCAIFADTGWEPSGVYNWLSFLVTKLPFPVITVGSKTIKTDTLEGCVGGGRTTLPFYTKNVTSAGDDSLGKALRKCTHEYKIKPIESYIRSHILNLKKGEHAPKVPVVTQWRGISIDEASRMKPSTVKWMVVRYPLALEYSMSRKGCLDWLTNNGYPHPPRSACIGCPYHSNEEWLSMKETRPSEFEDAVGFDKAIRKVGGMNGETFLHRSCIPLDEVDFAGLMKKKNKNKYSLGDFAGECEGMCGL